LAQECGFLGSYYIRKWRVVDSKKVEAIVNWARLTNALEVRSFLGLVGYYRKFVEDFSKIVGPLTRLTQKKVKFE
jgi:hypothetical protein